MRIRTCHMYVGLLCCLAVGAEPPGGLGKAVWGMSPAQVRTAVAGNGWQQVADAGFDPELNVDVYTTSLDIAGYPSSVRYYFFEDRLFQATARFPFSDLENFDFNYNVFRSVDEYYQAIRSRTLTFVHDMYALMRDTYGKKEPVFKGLDPRQVFVETDKYIRREWWNLRYHPYDYYKRIVTAAYARWNFPRTTAIFSVNISAADKRFDYQLSLTSLPLEKAVRAARKQLRSEGL